LFMGGTPAEAPALQGRQSGHVCQQGRSPVLTLHGDQDALVPIEQATALDEKMKAAGASHTLMIFKGQGHGFAGEHGKKAPTPHGKFFDRI